LTHVTTETLEQIENKKTLGGVKGTERTIDKRLGAGHSDF